MPRDHGPSACAMAFRVKDAKAAFERAVRLGAKPVNNDVAHGEMDIPAIEGIGGSRLFFVDRYGEQGLDLRGRFRLLPRRGSEAEASSTAGSPTSTT